MAEKIKKQDQVEMKSMTLGDHIEELRIRLILAFSGLFVGFLIALLFGKFIFALIVHPYTSAVGMINTQAGAADVAASTDAVNSTTEIAKTMPIMQAIQPAEKFLMYIKCCLIFGLLIAAPWVFYQIWKFVAPGLYKNETKFVYIVTPLSAFLFMGGVLFFILGLAPYALNFFIGFDVGVDYVETVLTLSSYIGFMLSLSLAFGIAFQLPIVLFFAERLGIVKLEQLKQARKFVFLGLFVAAAALTPPDPITMTSLAIPMYILFEGSMLISSICRKKKKEKVTEEDGN